MVGRSKARHVNKPIKQCHSSGSERGLLHVIQRLVDRCSAHGQDCILCLQRAKSLTGRENPVVARDGQRRAPSPAQNTTVVLYRREAFECAFSSLDRRWARRTSTDEPGSASIRSDSRALGYGGKAESIASRTHQWRHGISHDSARHAIDTLQSALAKFAIFSKRQIFDSCKPMTSPMAFHASHIPSQT